MKPLKNEKGMALVTVIMVMAVMVILGTVVLSLSMSDTSFAKNQEQNLQAEYIARGGADAAAKYVQDHPDIYPTSGFSTQTVTGTLGEGSFSAVISRPFQGAVRVSSTGTVGGVSKTVNLNLSKAGYSGLFTGIRQTNPNTELDLGALGITYDSGAKVEIQAHVQDPDSDISLSTHNPNNEGDLNISKTANYDPSGGIIIPNYSSFSGTTETVSGVTTITGDSYLSTLATGNHESIVFNTQGNTQTVVVETLDFSGPQATVEIVGGGSVQLYILDNGTIDNPTNVNGGSPWQLFIYVADGGTISLGSNCNLTGYIAAPSATIELQSDHTTVTGAMIGNIVKRNNTQGAHGQLHYVPLPSNVDYTGYVAYKRDYYSN